MTWQTVRLDEIAEIVGGSTPKTGVAEYWNGDIPWVTPADLSNLPGPYIGATPRMITAAGLSSSGSKLLAAGSVLLSSRAPIGHVAINSVPMATNQGFKSLVPDATKVISKYLYWWLRTNKDYLQSLGNGATFKEISKAIVSRVEVQLPSIPEQRRLAAILDQAEELRTKRCRAAGLLDELAVSVFAEMFGPGGPDLETRTLGEVVHFSSGKFLPAKNMNNAGDVPVFGGNGINGYHDEAMFEEPQIVVGRVGAYCGVVHGTPSRSWVTDNALIANWDRSMFHFDYLSDALRESRLNSLSSQSGQPLISSGRIAGVKIAVPSMAVQTKYSDRIRRIQNLKRESRNQLRLFDELLASIQYRAFRGEL
ncbi:restriction endonuclease subunit S [Cryobacterium sp. MDB2-10]|uniref:restriction endonuclease subunit S n=1 Tax=Cryobacterium sp. MDB2-10 TaxID=1259177 RepID=UPI00107457E5|nr:restriction endonuclease subunit S [Cryobacterium sp. MDB2-10]TFC19919.1 restriction endonuclease subunit S [Cryobacterium sp. MDB2-10]